MILKYTTLLFKYMIKQIHINVRNFKLVVNVQYKLIIIYLCNCKVRAVSVSWRITFEIC